MTRPVGFYKEDGKTKPITPKINSYMGNSTTENDARKKLLTKSVPSLSRGREGLWDLNGLKIHYSIHLRDDSPTHFNFNKEVELMKDAIATEKRFLCNPPNSLVKRFVKQDYQDGKFSDLDQIRCNREKLSIT